MSGSLMMIVYALFAACWGFRLWGLRTMLRIYRFHGPEWWFDFRMPPDFYQNQGKRLLRGLRTRMLGLYGTEALVSLLLLWWRGPLWAMVVMGATAIASGFYVTATLKAFARAGRPFALEGRNAASTMPLSLQPRVPGNYRYPWLETTLRAGIAISLLLLAYSLVRPNRDSDVVRTLSAPAMIGYVLAGIRLIKGGVVDWRLAPAPGVDPEIVLYWQDAVRRQVLLPFEWARGCAVLILMGWAVLCVRPADWEWHTSATWTLIYPLLTAWVVMIVFLLRSQRRFVALGKTIRPDGWRREELPPVEANYRLGGRLLFDPDNPTMLVRGPRGLALNGSHRRTRLSLAYLGGWVVLAAGITVVHSR